MTDNLTPTLTDRFSDPKTMGMIALGLFGVGILIGWKLAGGQPVQLEQPVHVIDVEPEVAPFPYVPPYNVDDAGAAAFESSEE